MTDLDEIERIKEEEKYWKQLEEYLPWRLFGWSFKDNASFNVTNEQSIRLTREAFEDLLTAFQNT